MKKTTTLSIFLSFLLLFTSKTLFSQGVGYSPDNSYFLNLASSAASGGVSTATRDVYFDFYKSGVTDFSGQGPGVTVVIKLRTESDTRDATYAAASSVYQTITAVYASDDGNNDRYKATLPIGLPNGRYTWECEATHGGVTYKSWDYTTKTGNSLQYFTVGGAGIYRSMLITDVGSGNTYYDLLKFQPGNLDLPAQLAGPNNGGFCSSGTLNIGAEINTYKNNWYGGTDVSANRMFYRVTAISAKGTSSNLNTPGAWNSFTLPYRDNCQGSNFTYVSTFAMGGSCQIDDAAKIDQRWDRRGSGNAMANVLPAASTVCPVTAATGAVTYKLEVYTETDVYANSGNSTTRNPLATNAYYSTLFEVNGLATTASNGYQAGDGCALTLLPIKLIDFTAQAQKDNIAIKWTTASEKNADQFKVERSPNGKDWHEIMVVSAHNNSDIEQKYNVLDRNPYADMNYYRLREVDFDGSYTYSNVVTARFGKSNSLHLFPNPVGEQLTLELGLSEVSDSDYVFSIYDIQGKTVQQWTQNLADKNNHIERNIGNISPGLYFLKVQNQDGTSVQESHFVKK